jgi:hypothetical protein
MQLRNRTTGALTLFTNFPFTPSAVDAAVAQALANAATISIIHMHEAIRNVELNEQLQLALNSRVVIEQVKGVVSQTLEIAPDGVLAIFARTRARRTSQTLREVSARVVDRSLIL